MEYIEHFVDNAGVRVHCLEFHPQMSTVPLIIVPGMIVSAEEVVQQIGDFLCRRTIIISLRGRGKSDSPIIGWKLEDQASDIAAIARYFNLQEIFLFGHSTGASIATRSLPLLFSKVSGFIIGDFAPYYPQYNADWRDRILQLPDRQISNIALNGIVAEARRHDVSAFLPPISSSLLVITGDAEKSMFKPTDLAKLIERFPLLKVEILAGCAHEFLSDDPQRSVGVIERFLIECEEKNCS